MLRKKNILILLGIIFLSFSLYAQPIVCSSTEFMSPTISSPSLASLKGVGFFNIDDLYINESFSWRDKYNAYNEEKDCYYSHSIYIKDSELGLRLLSIDFNPFHDKFETYKLNQFTQRNKVRIRFSLLMEYYPFDDYYVNPENTHVFSKFRTYYDMINMDMYIHYTHISKTARGDYRTKQRKGSWGFVFWGDLKRRMLFTFQVKTGAYVWSKFRYKKEYSGKKMALLFEIQLNKNGYSHTTTESSKDIYKGMSIVFGPEYNMTYQRYVFNLGVKYNYRNH